VYSGRYVPTFLHNLSPPHGAEVTSRSITDVLSVGMSWCRAPDWAHGQILLVFTFVVLSSWDVGCEDRTGLWLAVSASLSVFPDYLHTLLL
jgi:hypothetical protein